MDLRLWLLLQDRPPSNDAELVTAIQKTPCSADRSPSTLRLWRAARATNYKLTDADGQPTDALRLMATLMGARLCQADGMTPEEQKALIKEEEGTLIRIFSRTWYLHDITDRIKAIQGAYRYDLWVLNFLPRLRREQVSYRDPDGKRRKRVCWVAECPPDWEVSDHTYGGLYKWTHEHYGPPNRAYSWSPAKWPDAYTLLKEHPALVAGGDGQGEGGGAQERGSPS